MWDDEKIRNSEAVFSTIHLSVELRATEGKQAIMTIAEVGQIALKCGNDHFYTGDCFWVVQNILM